MTLYLEHNIRHFRRSGRTKPLYLEKGVSSLAAEPQSEPI